MDSVHSLVESLDRDDQANDDRIPQLKSLVRQLQFLLNRWKMLAIRASSHVSGASAHNQKSIKETVVRPTKLLYISWNF